METSPFFDSSTLAVPSPNGQYVASITLNHLYIQYAHSLETAFTFPLTPDRASSKPSRPNTRSSANLQSKSSVATSLDSVTIQWSHTSEHILLISPSGLGVFSLANTERRVRISNGSAGLGRIVAADMVGLRQGGEQVLVVWEFGRVAVWDFSTGRAAEELGDLKIGGGRLSSAWGVRRIEGKVEVLALLGRSGAQDILSLFLPPSTTPFRTMVLATIDAQSITWSSTFPAWLSVLDTPLAAPSAPSLYIYTGDGYLYRTWPNHQAAAAADADGGDGADDMIAQLGPKSLAWSPHSNLALAASATSDITMLSTRTFAPFCTLDPGSIAPDFCHRESSSFGSRGRGKGGDAGQITYNLLASNSIPLPAGGLAAMGTVMEMKWSTQGSFLAVRYENVPSTVLVWRVPLPSPSSRARPAGHEKVQPEAPVMIQQLRQVEKLVWHPARDSLLMMLSGTDEQTQEREDGGVYLFDAAGDQPPLHLSLPLQHGSPQLTGTDMGIRKTVEAQFVSSAASFAEASVAEAEKLRLLVSRKRKGWFMVYPEGRDEDVEEQRQAPATPSARTEKKKRFDKVEFERGGEETEHGEDDDSLYDILTGRTPLPPLSNVSREAHADGGAEEEEEEEEEKEEEEEEEEEDGNYDDEDEDQGQGMTSTLTITNGLEDTFREKLHFREQKHEDDDSREAGQRSTLSWEDEIF
ncbi:hypothetical protein AAFC00_000231 [Neodothiora populina]|uniref:Uncharacterized protein n=1 Tax=Neodothiora populina TaxID=2781224 RepID=A0ABR3P268_9PEZI